MIGWKLANTISAPGCDIRRHSVLLVEGENMSAIQIALGAAVGAVIGVLIGDVTHLTGYWPHLVVARAAGGVFLTHMIWPRK